MSSDFYTSSILPYAGIIIKICTAYTNTPEDFQDYYQEVCLQIEATTTITMVCILKKLLDGKVN